MEIIMCLENNSRKKLADCVLLWFFCRLFVMLPRLLLWLLKLTRTLSWLSSQRTFAKTLSFRKHIGIERQMKQHNVDFQLVCSFLWFSLRVQTFAQIWTSTPAAHPCHPPSHVGGYSLPMRSMDVHGYAGISIAISAFRTNPGVELEM